MIKIANFSIPPDLYQCVTTNVVSPVWSILCGDIRDPPYFNSDRRNFLLYPGMHTMMNFLSQIIPLTQFKNQSHATKSIKL